MHSLKKTMKWRHSCRYRNVSHTERNCI